MFCCTGIRLWKSLKSLKSILPIEQQDNIKYTLTIKFSISTNPLYLSIFILVKYPIITQNVIWDGNFFLSIVFTSTMSYLLNLLQAACFYQKSKYCITLIDIIWIYIEFMRDTEWDYILNSFLKSLIINMDSLRC